MDGKYDGLIRFIRFTEKDLNVKICIKDYVDFIFVDRELNMGLRDNLVHGNPFCMYMKSDGDVYLKCTSMGQGVMRRLERDPRAYCGVCHAGVKEYVCPIWSDGRLVGSVNAGVFATEKRYVRRYLERVCRKSHLEVERALELYETCISASRVDEERLFVNLEMIANAFSLIFARVNVHGEYVAMRPSTVIMHNSIISDALEYLKQNYLEDLHASDVAAYCHCSISCLSHLFKSRVGTSLPLYIAKLRVDFAREELTNSRAPVSVVAERAGFSDPNYFSRIFTQYVGLTPSQYRKRFSQKSLQS